MSLKPTSLNTPYNTTNPSSSRRSTLSGTGRRPPSIPEADSDTDSDSSSSSSEGNESNTTMGPTYHNDSAGSQSYGLERTYSNTTVTGNDSSTSSNGGSSYAGTLKHGSGNAGAANGYGGGGQNGGGRPQQQQQQQQAHQQTPVNGRQHNEHHAQQHENNKSVAGGGAGGGDSEGALSPAQLASLPWGAPFPSLHLWPLNETFVMKMIHLPAGQRIKIGRQTNVKTVPGERNGYFDSKVLSRMHAEIWEEEGKIFIKDVKSSNGTFVNGDRLSPEGVESEPFELKSEDMIEFGIDIVSEDNKTTLHHKVAAKAYCVFSIDDAGLSSRELSQYYPFDPSRGMGPARKNGGTNGSSGQSMMSMNMMSAGGKIQGLNFDHMLHKLQSELQKSRETGAELQNLTTAMTDIQETLSGGMAPADNGSATKYIPPQFQPNGDFPASAMGDTSATIAALQAQLQTTQSILVSHKDRIRQLETMLNEHEAIKDEVLGMRQQLEDSKRDIEDLVSRHTESEQQKVEEDKTAAAAKKGPSDGDIADSVFGQESPSSGEQAGKKREGELAAQTQALTARLDGLTVQLEEAISLSSTLQSQHAEATSTVKLLEERLQALERDMSARISDDNGRANRAAEERWEAWRAKFEESWRREREGWDQERERLRGVVREWEEASRRAQEEEEERMMNGRLTDEDESEDDGEDEVLEVEDESLGRTRSRSLSGDDWIGASDDAASEMRRSQSSSPRQSARPSMRQMRRGSQNRLDPAIRALRATAGDVAEAERSSREKTNGAVTPRTQSPSAADSALGALRAKSARAKRAGTITRTKRKDSDSANDSDHTTKVDVGRKSSALSKSVAADGDLNGSECTSTESDETAHVGERAQEQTQAAAESAKRNDSAIVIQHPIPLAISVAVLGVAAYAYLHRVKD